MSDEGGGTQGLGPDRVSLNPLALAYGVARGPEGDEVVVLEDGWEDHIPDTNEGLPIGFPFVQYKDLTVKELDQLRAEQLGEALAVVEEETGIGPWEVRKTGGLSCGPAVTGYRTGDRKIGSAPDVVMRTSVTPTDDQFFEVINILDRFYPGIAEPQNQVHRYDEVGHRAYDMLTDDDTWMQVVYKTRMSVSIFGGCYLTKDQVAWAVDKDIP